MITFDVDLAHQVKMGNNIQRKAFVYDFCAECVMTLCTLLVNVSVTTLGL